VALDQDIFALEFGVRVAARWRVALRFDAEMVIKKLRPLGSEQLVDLLFCPDVKGTLDLL